MLWDFFIFKKSLWYNKYYHWLFIKIITNLKYFSGTGYNLTIVKGESCDESKLMQQINAIIPEAKVQSSLTAQSVINLPNENIDQFPDLFRMLEINKIKFGIKGMGISCTTMEEVFLR